MNYFDLHCDTISECYNNQGALYRNKMQYISWIFLQWSSEITIFKFINKEKKIGERKNSPTFYLFIH